MHTPEAVNGSVRPSNAAVNHGTPQSNLVKIDPKTLLPQVDDLISNPTVRISSLDPSHTVLLEHSILPYIKSRNLQLTFNRRDLTKQTDNVNTPSDTEDMVVVRAERLVTHPNSKWCWKTVSSQYPTVPLFTNISPPHIIKSTSEGMMIDLSAVAITIHTRCSRRHQGLIYILMPCAGTTVINIFRFVVQNKSNPSMCERIMFTLNLSDSQAPESGIQYCNDITLEICRDVDPLWSWYWQDNKRALSQKNRVLSVMDMIPLEDKMNAEPQLILTPPQPVLTWEKPADMDFNQIAQQFIFITRSQQQVKQQSSHHGGHLSSHTQQSIHVPSQSHPSPRVTSRSAQGLSRQVTRQTKVATHLLRSHQVKAAAQH
ncbi:hypothetical protein AKO1_002838 [Acrasis kona]|uniref:Uncharacterized protein n=1 Tax=Acrasis kona TaxID=1008807 RepID=A0AAW2ZFP6_9EUKA